MAIDARNRLLPDWFTRVRTHQLVLPRFQRYEAWGDDGVSRLFNTILRDLPVGAVLVLEVGNEEQFLSRPISGAPETGERVAEHLLDGQQRLTALWRGLHNNYPSRTYFLHVAPDTDDESGTSAPYYVTSIGRWRNSKGDVQRPLWANEPEKQWERRMIPLDLCAPGEDAPKRIREWARLAEPDRDLADALIDKVSEVRGKLAAFNLPYLALPATTPKETALDVFIKMNTAGAPLTIYDIVVAQVEAGLGKSLHDLVADTRERCPTIAAYYRPEVLALYAGALIQGRPPTNKTYLAPEFGRRLMENWELYLEAVKRTVTFLEEERILDSERLPTDVVVPVLVALWAAAPNGLDGEGRARTALRRYMWRAFFTNRYERSTSSRALADYTELLPLVRGRAAEPADGADVAAEPSIFDAKEHRLPHLDELKVAGWPKKKDRLGRAILALSLTHGGLDLADGSTVTRENLAKREYHHLFPVARLREREVPDDQIYRSLNCALVTWHTNRNISAKEPERYLAERRDGSDLGEAEVRRRLASHLIPYDEMIGGDYDAFLTKRAELVHAAMETLCGAREA